MEALRASLRDVAVEIDEETDEAHEKHMAKKAARADAARAKIAAAKAKIEEMEESIDKSDREELILDLYAYAEECQEIADYMTGEAEAALKAAAQQTAIFNEKYVSSHS